VDWLGFNLPFQHPSRDRLEQIRRRYLDLWIQKLPFEIIFSGLFVIIFLQGHPSKGMIVGLLTAAIATVAMYGKGVWPCESNKAKSLWCFGINFIFWAPAILIAPHLGKFLLLFIAVAAVLIPLTFVLEWIYERLFARRS
jgi:hypothetical protein